MMSKTYDKFLNDYLQMWKDEGVEAPLNELQSIAAWLRYLGSNGKEKTIEAMQMRMLLLMDASNKLHAQGPEAEDAAGIYNNRPDLRPTGED
jgi:hypothetical protein